MITPVILSGGSGTRLWPVSRSLNPKQFLDFFGKNSLFQQTALRTHDHRTFNAPIIICNNEHRFTAAEELQKLDIKPQSIILEPMGRNTAPAIAVAALEAISRDKENDLILVMPSDHMIKDEKGFVASIRQAAKAARAGYLVTFGIVPNKAETGYGYIKKGQLLKQAPSQHSTSKNAAPTEFEGVVNVEEFIEKPDQETATKLFKSKDYLWNGGIFLFKATKYLSVLKHLQNDMFIHCCNSYNKAEKDLDFIRLDAEEFEKCEDISIDYAVMEKADEVAVTPIKVGWSDVGSWQAVSDITPKDKNKNSLIGDVHTLDTKNCYVHSRSGLVATIGVKDLIIISLKDVTLVANKNNSQDVKKLFNTLKELKRDECNAHTKVMRPWGSFETMDMGDGFKVKKIVVNPKGSLSLQMHDHRAEHWVVVKGTAYVTCDDKKFMMTEDESTYIPIGKKHRLENKGKIPLELIEVQTGSYLGEDDITRFDDIYGR